MVRRRNTIRAFAIVWGVAILGGAVGAVVGVLQIDPDILDRLGTAGIDDPKGFLTVAYLHYGSYAGGIVGSVIAIVTSRHRAEKLAM